MANGNATCNVCSPSIEGRQTDEQELQQELQEQEQQELSLLSVETDATQNKYVGLI